MGQQGGSLFLSRPRARTRAWTAFPPCWASNTATSATSCPLAPELEKNLSVGTALGGITASNTVNLEALHLDDNTADILRAFSFCNLLWRCMAAAPRMGN